MSNLDILSLYRKCLPHKHYGICLSDDSYITEERNITVCLDPERAESDYNTFGIEDFFCEDELETIEEVILRLEEWRFSDNPDDFSREEIKRRQLK